MKKFLKRCILLLLLAAIAFGGYLLWKGVDEADRYERMASLDTLVEEVRNREDYVPYDQVSPYLYEATIAVEDARYYQHGAIDYLSLARAMVSQVVPWMPKSGGSTIAMQVVKNLYHQFESSPSWKISEMVLAHRLCEKYSKEEILSIYVNIINYGDDFHGISQAAYGYYQISPAQLSQGQATILAGIPQSPVSYALFENFENARAKQQVVLAAMVRNHMIDSAQADEIFAQPCEPVRYELTGMNAGMNLISFRLPQRMTLYAQANRPTLFSTAW